MYKGFDLKLDLKEDHYFKENLAFGKKYFDANKLIIRHTFESFLYPDGSVDGSKMQTIWFPKIEADVFISHSHKNQELAIAVAGWLKKYHDINAFVDSCLWGYANDLQLQIDSEFSWTDQKKASFAYNKVNYSSSHIHMMLSTALSMMIDRTECLIFLNTPDSIVPYEKLDQTKSPWIYSEIVLSKLIKVKPPERIMEMTETYSQFSGADKKLEVKYNLDLSHLTKLNHSTFFNKWGIAKYKNKFEALNALYKITNGKI